MGIVQPGRRWHRRIQRWRRRRRRRRWMWWWRRRRQRARCCRIKPHQTITKQRFIAVFFFENGDTWRGQWERWGRWGRWRGLKRHPGCCWFGWEYRLGVQAFLFLRDFGIAAGATIRFSSTVPGTHVFEKKEEQKLTYSAVGSRIPSSKKASFRLRPSVFVVTTPFCIFSHHVFGVERLKTSAGKKHTLPKGLKASGLNFFRTKVLLIRHKGHPLRHHRA